MLRRATPERTRFIPQAFLRSADMINGQGRVLLRVDGHLVRERTADKIC